MGKLRRRAEPTMSCKAATQVLFVMPEVLLGKMQRIAGTEA